MIGNICLLLEIVTVVFCLHNLYGEKVKLDIITVSFLAIYMILMSAINYYKLPWIYCILIYPIIAIYCGIKFGFRLKEIIINNILYMIIIGGMQLICIICYGWIFSLVSFNMLAYENEELLIINFSVLLVTLIVLSKIQLNKLSIYLQDKERILFIFLIFCVVIMIFGFTNYKVFYGIEIIQYLLLFVSLTLFCILAGKLGKYKVKSTEIETELRMQKLYADSFHSLIEDIRMRQHEFDNHISAIYSLHYTCDTYEKLVKAQNEYSEIVIKENRHNKLLKVGNPLLIGFLYGKFLEIEKEGIIITYQISVNELKVKVPIHKLVEVLGNLMKNAVEAIEKTENNSKELYVKVMENDETFELEVRNKGEFIDYNQMEQFFKKGYSKKGENRGLGLYNVKIICNEYDLNILYENKIIDEANWVSFIINNKKEVI